jgi:hypothetical protein
MGARPADVRLVPPALKIGASLFVILALAGCGAASEETAEQQSDTIVQVERPDPFGPLPTDACFLGIRKYDLQLLAESPRGDALCTELDDRYLETDERLPWPPPDPVHRELFNASRCILEREQEFISVAAADDGWAVDRADTICEGLEGRGWTSYDHLPDEESTDEDTGSASSPVPTWRSRSSPGRPTTGDRATSSTPAISAEKDEAGRPPPRVDFRPPPAWPPVASAT